MEHSTKAGGDDFKVQIHLTPGGCLKQTTPRGCLYSRLSRTISLFKVMWHFFEMLVKNACRMNPVHVSSKPHALRKLTDIGSMVILLVQITSQVCSSWVACWQTEDEECWQTGIIDTRTCCKSVRFLFMFECTAVDLHLIYLWLCIHDQLDPLLI